MHHLEAVRCAFKRISRHQETFYFLFLIDLWLVCQFEEILKECCWVRLDQDFRLWGIPAIVNGISSLGFLRSKKLFKRISTGIFLCKSVLQGSVWKTPNIILMLLNWNRYKATVYTFVYEEPSIFVNKSIVEYFWMNICKNVM